MKQTLLNMLGSTLIGLSALTVGYTQETKTSKTNSQETKTPETKISLADYPDYFAETVDGIEYYFGKYTSKKSKKMLTYLRVTHPAVNNEIVCEIYWDDGDCILDSYEMFTIKLEYESRKEIPNIKRKHKEITAEDKKNYGNHLITIRKIIKEKEKEKKEMEESR